MENHTQSSGRNISANGYLGMTPPISYTGPTLMEQKDLGLLYKYMESRDDIFDTDENLHKKDLIIRTLNHLVVEWVTSIGISKNIPHENVVNGGGVSLQIFGSQKLGVQGPDSDIDILCLAPNYIERSEFFSLFCEGTLAQHPSISMMFTIPEAFTPVAKFYMNGQAIDMIFVSLADVPRIPNYINVLDPKYLKGLDDAGIRSINGVRVAQKVLSLVPNIPVFGMALRAIKHWAKIRGAYSSVLGFLGGVNCAILVAYICQLYVNANAATIVRKFFMIFSQWRWPNAVLLAPVEEKVDIGGRYLVAWNPKINPKDASHRMPIITPAYPSMNSAYNVGLPQYRMLQEEIFRGQLIFQANPTVFVNGLTSESRDRNVWEDLFTPTGLDFFGRYPRYVQIDISAGSAEEQRSWFGWCESRLRMFIIALEQPPLMSCHPQANCYHRQLKGQSDGEIEDAVETLRYVSSFFFGLDFRDSLVDITPCVQEFCFRTGAWTGKQPSMTISIETRLPEEIPDFVFETVAHPSSVLKSTPNVTPFKSPTNGQLSPHSSLRHKPFGKGVNTSPRGATARTLFFDSSLQEGEYKFGTVDASMLEGSRSVLFFEDRATPPIIPSVTLPEYEGDSTKGNEDRRPFMGGEELVTSSSSVKESNGTDHAFKVAQNGSSHNLSSIELGMRDLMINDTSSSTIDELSSSSTS